MSSNQFASTPERGTYMSYNGRHIYVKTHTLEDLLVNFQYTDREELTPKIHKRLREVFSTSSSETEPDKTYIMVAFDYIPENLNDKDKYTFAGFWNPNSSDYEFSF